MDNTTGDLKLDEYEVLKKIFSSKNTIAVHAEGNNVQKAVELIQHTSNKLYVCHISSKKELHDAKNKNVKGQVFAEVCPHHRLLS